MDSYNDLTYFIIHQLKVIKCAINELQAYLRYKAEQIRNVEAQLRGSSLLNHRQLVVVNKALRGSQDSFTIKGHAYSQRVAMQSARTDLLGLERLGLFTKKRIGRKFVFTSVVDLGEQLRRLANPAS